MMVAIERAGANSQYKGKAFIVILLIISVVISMKAGV